MIPAIGTRPRIFKVLSSIGSQLNTGSRIIQPIGLQICLQSRNRRCQICKRSKCNLQAMKESQAATTEEYIMTTAKEPTDNDFERMMHMITGYWVTQIAGAVASYSIADHLAKGSASAEEISKMTGI